MKAITAVTLFSALTAVSSFGQKLPDMPRPRILIMSTIEPGDGPSSNMNQYSEPFGNIVAERLSKQITCANIITRREVGALIAHDRARVLLTGQEGNLTEIAAAIGADYLIGLSVMAVGDRYFLNGSVATAGNAKTIARSGGVTDLNSLADEMEKYADKLAAELLALEICPFKGKIRIVETVAFNNTSEKDDSPKGQDKCHYLRSNSRRVDKELVWDLDKKRRVAADGAMRLSLVEENVSREQTNCTICSQVDENNVVIGVLTTPTDSDWTLSKKEETKTQGLRNPEGERSYYPAVVAIKFDVADGTYTVAVKATSEVGTYSKDVVEKLSTSCRRKAPLQNDHETHPYRVNLKTTFGPYPGKPSDKTLKQDVQNSYTSDFGDGKVGKTTESVAFEFNR